MDASPRIPDLLFGVAYYPEYYPDFHLEHERAARLERDLDLMVDAHLNVIRVGESVWSTWEPRDGEFDLEWLAPVLDAAHERGISVILGTPTYAVPPWLQQAYPEIAAENAPGHIVPWGGRQEVDYTHPAFLFHAERVIRRIVARYAGHPAVIGFQVDNEPGLHLFHSQSVVTRFVRELAARYGDPETLNREWGLTYWSHRITDWSQLWRPDGNSFPQYDLAWRRFQNRLTTQFLGWQADIVREYARPDQFVTTCVAYPRRGVDDREVGEVLDVAAGNPYYGMQDRLDATKECTQTDGWTTTGVAGLLRQADRLYSSRQARYLVTETNAQAIGDSAHNTPPYPGQLALAALALVSRGAAMVEYWHWHTLPYGTETYWGGVLPHSLEPGRVYREVAELGTHLDRLAPSLAGYEPDADVAVLWSNPSRLAMQFMPPFPVDGRAEANGDPEAYERIFDAFHRGVVDAGCQARIVHPEQLRTADPAELVRRFPVLVAAGVYITTDEDLELLRAYAEEGGHLVLGPRTGYADDEARARVAVAPPGLVEAAGVSYEEFSNLEGELRVLAAEPGFDLLPTARARLWVDGLRPAHAQVLATYDHSRFGDFPAVTTAQHGAGRVTTVGCVPSPELASAVVRFACPDARVASPVGRPALPLTLTSGRNARGERLWFLLNWGWQPQRVELTAAAVDVATGQELDAGATVELGAWGGLTLRTGAEVN